MGGDGWGHETQIGLGQGHGEIEGSAAEPKGGGDGEGDREPVLACFVNRVVCSHASQRVQSLRKRSKGAWGAGSLEHGFNSSGDERLFMIRCAHSTCAHMHESEYTPGQASH